VLRFDQALEPEVVRWELGLDPGAGHVLRTPAGLKLAAFLENGALRALVEYTGSGAVTTQTTLLDDMGGAGLPLPENKLAMLRAAAAAGDAELDGPAEPAEADAGVGGDD
jgi:hypothetical protein